MNSYFLSALLEQLSHFGIAYFIGLILYLLLFRNLVGTPEANRFMNSLRTLRMFTVPMAILVHVGMVLYLSNHYQTFYKEKALVYKENKTVQGVVVESGAYGPMNDDYDEPQNIFAVFDFNAGEQEIRAVSYASYARWGSPMKKGTQVDVEYLVSEPAFARIKGMEITPPIDTSRATVIILIHLVVPLFLYWMFDPLKNPAKSPTSA